MMKIADGLTLGTSIFEKMYAMGHEQVVFCRNESTGLKAIISIHNTVLGPSLGGLRMLAYPDETLALNDVLRLSKGMTFKNAIAGLNLGGGKAIIIGDPHKDKSEALLRAFAKYVQTLNGKYITAEDVGMTTRDIEHILAETNYVSGKPTSRGGLGDPSPFTAYSTYIGMKAAAKKAYGTDSLEKKSVAIQGVGHVGVHLIKYLLKENCKIYVSEYYRPRLKKVVKKYNVIAVELDEIYDLDVDIYAPCALGASINDTTLKRLKCQIIAGCANNQLADERKHGDVCRQQGIIYAPDFLINAGGVINCYAEVVGTNIDWTRQHIEKNIYHKTLEILDIAAEEEKSAQEVAIALAMQRIESVRGL